VLLAQHAAGVVLLPRDQCLGLGELTQCRTSVCILVKFRPLEKLYKKLLKIHLVYGNR
jgi:hypothetical protein